MKNVGFLLVGALAFSLAGCFGGPGNASEGNGFVFDESEVNDFTNSEEGFEFSEDEAEMMNDSNPISDENVIDLGEEVIPPDDNLDIPILGDWLLTYDTLTTICPEGTNTFPPPEPDIAMVSVAEDNTIIYLDSVNEGQRLQFTLAEKGPGGARYTSSITSEGVTLNYTIYLFRYSSEGRYDWMEGSIDAQNLGCTMNRPFFGRPLE